MEDAGGVRRDRRRSGQSVAGDSRSGRPARVCGAAAERQSLLVAPHVYGYDAAMLLLGQGKFDEAIPHLERALQISPGLAQARYDLDAAQAKTPIRQP